MNSNSEEKKLSAEKMGELMGQLKAYGDLYGVSVPALLAVAAGLLVVIALALGTFFGVVAFALTGNITAGWIVGSMITAVFFVKLFKISLVRSQPNNTKGI